MSKNILLAIGIALLTSGCLVTRSAVKERGRETTVQEQVQQTKAQETAQLVEVDENMRLMRGRVEETENNINQLQMQSRSLDIERQKEMQAMNEKLRVYQETLARLESQYLVMAQKVEALSNPAPAKVVHSKSNLDVFEGAEILFNKKNYRLAAVEYDKYRKKFPNGKTYTEATYKIGYCFHELGMKEQAKVFYDEVIERLPKSKLAGLARQRLKLLK